MDRSERDDEDDRGSGNGPVGALKGTRVVWAPFPGSQTKFLTARPIHELLYHGTRAPGKTDALLVDYVQDVGRGHGPYWRGILFRKQYKQLDEIIAKSKKLFFQMFPGARWFSSKSDYKWVFPDGEELLLRAIENPDDYWNYHGHEYPWMGWDELTNWPTGDLYDLMMSCNRSTRKSMPRKIRSTTNPFGPGHGWVRQRLVDPAAECTPWKNSMGTLSMHIKGYLTENKAVMESQPEYLQTLLGIKREELRKAWAEGDWDIAVGGFFAGYWKPDVHRIKPFDIPVGWQHWRAMDWGFAKPYAVGWYAMSPEGTIYLYRELYGDGGEPNTGSRETGTAVAKAIKLAEAVEVEAGVRFVNNPADSSIWDNDGREQSIEEMFRKEGVFWVRAHKGPGSRKNGAMVLMRALEANSFFVFENCRHWLRTVPVLMPDPKDWEDIDTDMEDHHYDCSRYSLVSRHKSMRQTHKPIDLIPGTMAFVEKYGMQASPTLRRREILIGD